MSTRKKLSEAERSQRKHQRSADRKNAKVLAAIPLFADQEPKYDAAGEYWHWRRNRAFAGEHGGRWEGSRGLDLLMMQWARLHARRLVGEETFAKLDAHCRRVYLCPSYWYSFWQRVLTGERIEFAYQRVENRQPGQPACACTEWYEQRHMSREEFYDRFSFNDPPELPITDAERATIAQLETVFVWCVQA